MRRVLVSVAILFLVYRVMDFIGPGENGLQDFQVRTGQIEQVKRGDTTIHDGGETTDTGETTTYVLGETTKYGEEETSSYSSSTSSFSSAYSSAENESGDEEENLNTIVKEPMSPAELNPQNDEVKAKLEAAVHKFDYPIRIKLGQRLGKTVSAETVEQLSQSVESKLRKWAEEELLAEILRNNYPFGYNIEAALEEKVEVIENDVLTNGMPAAGSAGRSSIDEEGEGYYPIAQAEGEGDLLITQAEGEGDDYSNDAEGGDDDDLANSNSASEDTYNAPDEEDPDAYGSAGQEQQQPDGEPSAEESTVSEGDSSTSDEEPKQGIFGWGWINKLLKHIFDSFKIAKGCHP